MLWISRMNALFLRNFVRLVYRAEISDSRGLRNAKCHFESSRQCGKAQKEDKKEKRVYLSVHPLSWSIADSNRSPRHCQCRALAR